MGRLALEEAIVQLEGLLSDSSAPESAFQQLFETHDVVLETLGYVRWIPRPRLPRDEGWYEPDFLAQLPSGVWEIVELKTPTERVLLDRQRRNTFTASMASYLAQVDEYRDYFADGANRHYVEDQYGATVGQNPDATIVAGMSARLDALELHRHCRARGAHLNVLTFDQLLGELQRLHAARFAAWEGIEGLTIISVLQLVGSPPDRRRHYVYDIWDEHGAGCGVFIDGDGQLTLEAIEPTGTPHALKAGVSREQVFDRPLALSCEIGAGPDGVVLQLRIDDVICATQLLPVQTWKASLGGQTIGADRHGKQNAAFTLAEHMVYERVLTFRERHLLMAYLTETYGVGVTAT